MSVEELSAQIEAMQIELDNRQRGIHESVMALFAKDDVISGLNVEIAKLQEEMKQKDEALALVETDAGIASLKETIQTLEKDLAEARSLLEV
jgi:predicted  nucleic acid-binding Zn-ribbon protein